MLELLPHVLNAWKNERPALEENGTRLIAALNGLEEDESKPRATVAGLCDAAWWQLERSADPEWGGFGRAPKFPTPANLAFLWRDAATRRIERPGRAEHARKLALLQLARMREGGSTISWAAASIATRSIARGSCRTSRRCSTTRRSCSTRISTPTGDRACRVGGDRTRHRGVRRARPHRSRRGIPVAEDADSEGEEGRFYVWRPSSWHRSSGTKTHRRRRALRRDREGISSTGRRSCASPTRRARTSRPRREAARSARGETAAAAR
jgi:uncharacterized protein YyaL (SSP411 family)